MSSECSMVNNVNPNDEQTRDLPLEIPSDRQNVISELKPAGNDEIDSRNEGQLEQLPDQGMEIVGRIEDEEALVEKVHKMELSLAKTGGNAESNNNTGVVVQNKLSESLSFLQGYNSDQDDNSGSDISPQTDDDVAMKDLQFRDLLTDSEDSESEDTDFEDCDSNEDSMDDVSITECTSTNNTESFGAKKESGKFDLAWMAELALNEPAQSAPDISSLELNNREEFKHMGDVECTIDRFVTIVALPGMPAYDLDTLLFLEEGGKVLGYISDVMGPVSSPIYVIYLDSIETIESMQLQKGKKVYCAPKSKYTKYVFLQELMKVRGSDASWVGDVEVPQEFEEFSDDEEERRRRREGVQNVSQKRKHGSLERHQKFESNMNKINKMNSRLHKMMDERNLLRQRICDTKSKNNGPKNSSTSTSHDEPAFLTKPPPSFTQNIPNVALLPPESDAELRFRNRSSRYTPNHWSQALPPSNQEWQNEYYMPPPPIPCSLPASFINFDPSTPPPTYTGGRHCYPPLPDSINRGGPPIQSYIGTNVGTPNRGPVEPICRPNSRPGPSFDN